MRTIDNINDLKKSDFLSVFGNVFEKTESIAVKAFESKPFKNFEDIVFKMLDTPPRAADTPPSAAP